jgi:galactose mutarotase-like enzyme
VPAYAVTEGTVEGLPVRVLEAAEADLRAAFAPGAGMVGCSLLHRGEEVLGQRGGLARYAEAGSSMGIPLLHPWANRLDGPRYAAAGKEVVLDPRRMPVRLDPNGLPIHGLAVASPHWEVVAAEATESQALLAARLDWAAHEELMAGFPFAHELDVEVVLSGATLGIETTLRPTGNDPVPVSYGWHPYLTLPGAPRAEYEVEALPVRRRARLDERGLPTGDDDAYATRRGPLGEREYDDLFVELCHPPEWILRGGGRCLEVRFEAGYPFAQVYAPAGEDFICFEPMTAPTNALVTGEHLQTVEPGESHLARFSITVTDL